jgi:hypothetical protein
MGEAGSQEGIGLPRVPQDRPARHFGLAHPSAQLERGAKRGPSGPANPIAPHLAQANLSELGQTAQPAQQLGCRGSTARAAGENQAEELIVGESL